MAKQSRLFSDSVENDIRYRGPLSYQGFQVLGWLCIVLSFYVLLFTLPLRGESSPGSGASSQFYTLGYLSALSLPFLLIANFAKILNNTEGFRVQLIRNGCAALGLAVSVTLFFNRYVVGLINRFVTDPENVVPVLTESFRLGEAKGFLAFNIFTDLFLCTLFMFFLSARPKHFFTGKKLVIFRLFAILPVAYEVVSMVLKARASSLDIMLPLWSFPLLTVKPPMTFLVFVILALNIKRRERHFLRHGRTLEEYRAFLATNRNSLQFSLFMVAIMVLAAIVDYLLYLLVLQPAVPAGSTMEQLDPDAVSYYASIADAVGIGDASLPLLMASPFVLLFSYTRLPKNKRISLMIPLAAVCVIVLLMIESIYQHLGDLSAQFPPIPIRELFNQILNFLFDSVGGG